MPIAAAAEATAAPSLATTAGIRRYLREGQVIPAHPLALTADRKLDERRQRALTRYYLASGAGGLAVGVHTTQFAIRDAKYGLYEPVLELASETADSVTRDRRGTGPLKVAGICGPTRQAVKEAQTARRFGYHVGLLSLAAFRDADNEAVLEHCRAVAEVIPLVGFYLQPAVGGRVYGYRFWRAFFEIENVVAVKIAPFNRYQTIDVVRACIGAGRDDVALYTGNDDSIVTDLLTPWTFENDQGIPVTRHVVGGLLGHWAVWTKKAVELLGDVKRAKQAMASSPFACLDPSYLTRAVQVTDANAALFDSANGYAGCIAGIHEVLRRQDLLEGIWCLDPHENLSPGQADEITRVSRAYPEQTDDTFVARHLDDWLR